MHRSKRKRNIIIFSLVGVLLCMVAGYAAFQTQLKVTGTSKVTSNWDIEITNVTSGTPTGSAENTVAPSWDKLWASMEADLYDKGDAMEYDVTIENKGTLDAKLNDIITNLENSNNEAVIITFSGYTKGEILKAGNTKIVHVKIEYNPNYEGGETSSEVEINFDYTQNNNEENNPDSQYLLTYDYQTNGGQSVDLNQEYLVNGSNVDLSNTATKEGWNFVGWNTDKDAEVGLKSYQMPTSNTTLYAIYSKTVNVTYQQGENVTSIGKTNDSCNIFNNQTSCEITLPEITVNNGYVSNGWHSGDNKVGNANEKYSIKEDTTLTSKAVEDKIELSISTTSTTNSITVVANASATTGISKYEYSIDGGKTWKKGTNNTYTFTGLTQGTNYNIMVRVTSGSNKISNATKTTSTSTLSHPTFSISNGVNLQINYPSGCNNDITCSYQLSNGTTHNTTNSYTNIVLTANDYKKSFVATVSDGVNTTTSTYTVHFVMGTDMINRASNVNQLYKDIDSEVNRYIYRGSSPQNYITFNNKSYRITTVAGNTLKIISSSPSDDMINTPISFDNTSPISRYSSSSNNYCQSSSGCNFYGNNTGISIANTGAVTTAPYYPQDLVNRYNLPSQKSSLLREYESKMNSYFTVSKDKAAISCSKHRIGNSYGYDGRNITLNELTGQEGSLLINVCPALMTISDFLKASSNKNCYSDYTTGSDYIYINARNDSDGDGIFNCAEDNYLYLDFYNQPNVNKSYGMWTLTPYSYASGGIGGDMQSQYVHHINSQGKVGNLRANSELYARVMFKLSENTVYYGSGTKTDPYQIVGQKT